MHDGEYFCMLKSVQAWFLRVLDSSSRAEHSSDERYEEKQFKYTALHWETKKKWNHFSALKALEIPLLNSIFFLNSRELIQLNFCSSRSG